MCFHTALSATPAMLAKRYQKENSDIQDFSPSYHISAFNHDYYPIITTASEIQKAQWGLIPYWIKDSEKAVAIQNQTLNARSESVFTKPSFRGPIRHQRCLIPVTGFFDWRHEKDKKIPYFISLRDEEIFSLAGIYDYWKDPSSGILVPTFSILTTSANEMMAEIHNTNFRMPVILAPTDERVWLTPTLSEKEIETLAKPFPTASMQAYPIRNDFIKKSPSDPTILSPR